MRQSGSSLSTFIPFSKRIALPTKVRLVKAMVFPVVMYGSESWTVKKAECRRIDDLLIKIIVHFVSVT